MKRGRARAATSERQIEGVSRCLSRGSPGRLGVAKGTGGVRRDVTGALGRRRGKVVDDDGRDVWVHCRMRTIVAGGRKLKKAVTLLHLRLPRTLPLGQKASAIGDTLEVGPHAVQVHEIGDELVGLRSDD